VDLTPFHNLDRLIHERGRLGIMSLLATAESLTFKELRDLLEMTDGNLSVHMRTLEEGGYVNVHKGFVDRKPRTTYALTEAGRAAFNRYLETLEQIVRQSRAAEAGIAPHAAPPGTSGGPRGHPPPRPPRRAAQPTPVTE
jgi:DNA-binding MarR family transcriptional regulator